MITVGIDVSKGKSTVAAMKPDGEIVFPPFDVTHSANALGDLADSLRALGEDVRIALEHTGKYHQPIARYLSDAGLFVSVINPKLIHDFGNNSIRNVKTDPADAMKIASYAIIHWNDLERYSSEDDTRLLLKTYCRQFYKYSEIKTSLKNNLISILDQSFPDCNTFFTSPVRSDGHQKWIDFAGRFWHCDCVRKYSLSRFTSVYNSWCKRNGYSASEKKALQIYTSAKGSIPSLPCSKETKVLVNDAVSQINFISASMMSLLRVMDYLASRLPEYPVVSSMPGIGPVLTPQLIGEIGDVRRFHNKKALVAYAGVDAPPYQSGNFNSSHRHITKRGSGNIRRVTFQAARCIILVKNTDDPVFRFIDKKRAEGKPYRVYMIAGCNKFLRTYYGRVIEYLNTIS